MFGPGATEKRAEGEARGAATGEHDGDGNPASRRIRREALRRPGLQSAPRKDAVELLGGRGRPDRRARRNPGSIGADSSGNAPGRGSSPATRGRSCRLTEGGKSTQPKGSLGVRYTRPSPHRRQPTPERIAAHGRREVAVDRDDDLGIPGQHLLQRHRRQTAAPLAGDVAGADEFDALGVDRAREPGLEAARPARVVDPRPRALRDGGERLLTSANVPST